MTDALLLAASCAALAGGLAVCVALRRAGLASTHVRDLLHIAVGPAWVLTWRWWRSPLVPTLLVGAAALATALVPRAARRWRPVARLEGSFTGGDEAWAGLTQYTLAFFALTAVGLRWRPVPAAAALLALALGDGIGGLVGRRLGRVGYQLPWGKRKSLEGSLTVAIMAAAGAALAAAWLGSPLPVVAALAAGALAALVEAAAPRSSDNLLVPAAVWLLLAFF